MQRISHAVDSGLRAQQRSFVPNRSLPATDRSKLQLTLFLRVELRVESLVAGAAGHQINSKSTCRGQLIRNGLELMGKRIYSYNLGTHVSALECLYHSERYWVCLFIYVCMYVYWLCVHIRYSSSMRKPSSTYVHINFMCISPDNLHVLSFPCLSINNTKNTLRHCPANLPELTVP